MYNELERELDQGRMSGHFQAPEWWPIPSRGMDGRELQPLPTDKPVCFSFCFNVKQSDKIRRCEDFRRSGHNSTVQTSDSPHHHDLQTMAELAKSFPGASATPKTWAQDLNGAYRQFAVRNPNH